MNKLKNTIKTKKAITLIVLIITIVVLLVLAGVAVNLSMGENGIIGKAQTAVDKYKQAAENEEIELSKITEKISGNRSISEEDIIELIQREVKKINEEKNTVTQLVPAGTVISYIGSALPKGYLACNGDKYSVSEYPNLYNALKDLDHTGWKAADWETEFTVPDLQGEFLRGTGTNGHTNQGSGENVIGKHQDGTVNYTIQGSYTNKCLQLFNGTDWGLDRSDADSVIKTTAHQRFDVKDASRAVDNDTNLAYTSRPTNTSVLYCIKY